MRLICQPRMGNIRRYRDGRDRRMSDPRHWTPEQLFVLHWLYPDFTAEEVAGFWARQPGHPPESATAPHRQIGRLQRKLAAGAFRHQTPTRAWWQHDSSPGHKTWNKGVRARWVCTRTAAKRSSNQGKSHAQRNQWAPTASTTTKRIHRPQRKMNDDPGPNHVRWIPVTRLVWEQHHGPVRTSTSWCLPTANRQRPCWKKSPSTN